MSAARVRALVARITWLLDGVAVVALIAMMSVTTVDVLLRRFANQPITGATEWAELALGIAFFMAVPGVFARGANITVDMIDQWRPQWSVGLKRFAALLSAVMLGFFAWNMVGPLVDIVEFGDTSADLQLPKVWFMAPAWVGIVLALITSVAVLLAGELDQTPAAATEPAP
jgi:TRAP-type C4-dicarboxylate transport system permease small subunit